MNSLIYDSMHKLAPLSTTIEMTSNTEIVKRITIKNINKQMEFYVKIYSIYLSHSSKGLRSKTS